MSLLVVLPFFVELFLQLGHTSPMLSFKVINLHLQSILLDLHLLDQGFHMCDFIDFLFYLQFVTY